MIDIKLTIMMEEMNIEAPAGSKTTMAPPANYKLHGTLDLSKNRLAQLGILLAGTALLLPLGWLVLKFLQVIRPARGTFDLDVYGAAVILVSILALTVLMALIHESIHGLFFWLLTGQRPIFGFRALYAFAAAPSCHIPRDRYLVIGLAPLVLMSVIGISLLPVIPAEATIPVAAMVVFNGAGSAGDLLVVGWLLTRPRTTLVHDRGDAVSVYQPL